MKSKLTGLIILCMVGIASAQVLTNEDSLSAGLIRSKAKTILSGYGEAAYSNDLLAKEATVNLTRVVLFVGHKFNDRISFFSEIEVEDAKIEGGEPGGEVAMEQAFLKFDINRNNYLTAGLFIPRIGIINENHLPTTYNSVSRTITERVIIPSTWRELGVGLYGTIPKVRGLNYSLAFVNGLNSASFSQEKGIRGGRAEGHDAGANNLAVNGSMLYYIGNFRIQTSAYYGGTVPFAKAIADTLSLQSGPFGTPVMLNEVNLQYKNKGFYFQVLACIINIPDADAINAAFSNNISGQIRGGYLETGYNLLQSTKFSEKKMMLYARFEDIELAAKLPSNATYNKNSNRYHIFAGLTFQPVSGAIVKLGYESAVDANSTGTIGSIVTAGIGYSF